MKTFCIFLAFLFLINIGSFGGDKKEIINTNIIIELKNKKIIHCKCINFDTNYMIKISEHRKFWFDKKSNIMLINIKTIYDQHYNTFFKSTSFKKDLEIFKN